MADKSIKLSIALVTYNCEEYIVEALDSIMMQKINCSYEIVVADDCSTDNTLELIKRYQSTTDALIRILPSTENLGITKNYERVFGACKGRYIAILEGDDYWISPNKISTQIAFLDQNPNCSFCFHSLIMLNEIEKTATLSKNIEKTKPSVEDLILDNFIGNFSTCMYRAKIVRKILKMPELWVMAVYDWMFNIMNSRFGEIGFIPKALSVYRVHNTGAWSSKSSKDKRQEILVAIDQYNQFLNYEYDTTFQSVKLNYSLFSIPKEIEIPIQNNDIKISEDISIFIRIYHKVKPMIIFIAPPVSIFIVKKILNAIIKTIYIFKNREFSTKNISNYSEQINTDLIIFDDVFPHPLSAFRYSEYTEYLKYFDKIKIICSDDSFVCFKESRDINYFVNEYLDKFPLFKYKLDTYKPTAFYKPKLIYVNFLRNVVHFDLGYRFNVPFIVNLYPGGLLQVNDSITDNYFKKYLCSSYCKKVIVTQSYVYEYLVTNKLCPKEKIEFIFGGVISLELLDIKVSNKERYGFQKNTLDICFVAQKYTEYGIDKGYDKFIEAAHILVKKYDNINFHVVGSFDKDVIDVSKIRERIAFYGTQPTEWFKDFYKNKDIIISPNIPFMLLPGSFDGFPTGCVIEAGLNEVAMFVTDELDMNKNWFEDGKEIVIIKPSPKFITKTVEFYLKNPSKLQVISEAGALKIKDLFSFEKQIAHRISIIEGELDKIESN